MIAAAKPSPQESALVTDLQTKLQSLQVLPLCPLKPLGASNVELQNHAQTLVQDLAISP